MVRLKVIYTKVMAVKLFENVESRPLHTILVFNYIKLFYLPFLHCTFEVKIWNSSKIYLAFVDSLIKYMMILSVCVLYDVILYIA